MAPSSPHLLSSDFFQRVLSGAIASNVESFVSLLMSSYTVGIWEKIFQVLEAEVQQTQMMLFEGISKSKVEVLNMTHLTMPFTELDQENFHKGRGGGNTRKLGYAS